MPQVKQPAKNEDKYVYGRKHTTSVKGYGLKAIAEKMDDGKQLSVKELGQIADKDEHLAGTLTVSIRSQSREFDLARKRNKSGSKARRSSGRTFAAASRR